MVTKLQTNFAKYVFFDQESRCFATGERAGGPVTPPGARIFNLPGMVFVQPVKMVILGTYGIGCSTLKSYSLTYVYIYIQL
jgi:hypothetical protein